MASVNSFRREELHNGSPGVGPRASPQRSASADSPRTCRATGSNSKTGVDGLATAGTRCRTSSVAASACARRDENAYTMAATAVLRLIQAYDIDPRRVGYFALGTESSTDNSIGAVIVKGMVNDALRALGSPPLARLAKCPSSSMRASAASTR